MGTKTSTCANDKNSESTVKLLNERKNAFRRSRCVTMRRLRLLRNMDRHLGFIEDSMILSPHILIHRMVANDDPFSFLVLSSGSWAWIFVLARRLGHHLGVPMHLRSAADELGPI